MTQFGHETLKAYPQSIEFIAEVANIIEAIPRGHADLLDQLKRASISIALNIAEGSGKTTKREKQRFYSISRGSAMECAAIVDVLFLLKLISAEEKANSRRILGSITAILTSLCSVTTACNT